MMFDYSSTHICIFFFQCPNNIDQLVYLRSQARMIAILFVFLYDEIAHSTYLQCCKDHFHVVMCVII